MSASTNFQVTGCNSFCKIHCFHYFLWKSPSYKIWSCSKIGQGQPRFIIWKNYDGLESPNTTYQVSWKLLCQFQRRSLEGSYHIWVWQPSWSCYLDHSYKILFPLPNEAPHKISLWLAERFLRRYSNCWPRRTPEDGYTKSSSCEHDGLGELIICLLSVFKLLKPCRLSEMFG